MTPDEEMGKVEEANSTDGLSATERGAPRRGQDLSPLREHGLPRRLTPQ